MKTNFFSIHIIACIIDESNILIIYSETTDNGSNNFLKFSPVRRFSEDLIFLRMLFFSFKL